MKDNFKELIWHVHLIDESNRPACLKILSEFAFRFSTAPGSKSKHQAWDGGYIDHLNECMSLAKKLYLTMSSIRRLPFSISDVILVLYLHDIEKPFKYVEPVKELARTRPDVFKLEMIKEYKLNLTDEHLNALHYIHGEGTDYSEARVQGPLAAFCHMCDVASARIWYNEPK